MLAEVRTALRRLLHDRGLIEPGEVDVEFDAPVPSWVDALTRPTLNLFLFDVEENTDLRQTSVQTSRGNGLAVHRLPPRRFDLRFLVSALTTDVVDEQLLLWRALVTLLKHRTLPADVLPDALRTAEPGLVTSVGELGDGPRPLDLWSALEMRPRPALVYTVTVPVDLDVAVTAPLVLTRRVRYQRPGGGVEELGTHIGGVVRDPAGVGVAGASVSLDGRATRGAVTNARGEFTLTRVPSGRVTLQVARGGGAPKLVAIEIPSDSYEVVLD